MNNLTQTFSALADPTRREILVQLTKGEATVSHLVERFELTQPTISSHLKVLERAGLILRRIDGTRRPCRLAPEGFDKLDNWLRGLREAMEQNYQRLDSLLATLEGENSK